MNPVQLGLVAAVAVGLSGALATTVVPRRIRPAVAGASVVGTGAFGTVAGVTAMGGETWSASLPWLLPLSGVELAIDGLSGLFIAVAGAVAVAAGVYGVGYTRHGLDGRVVQATAPLFVLSVLLVPAAGSIGTLLLFWELMALTSLLLVLAEHGRHADVVTAGRWYAVMTHLGFVALLIGLLVLVVDDGSFGAIRAAEHPPAVAGLGFVLCLVGFGSKAGILPLHAWLPRAHPEAPSHVSALMSAAMVNLGAYGIVRVGFDLLGGGPGWWWLAVLVIGAASAVYGILQAAVRTDLKRLLGYSTTENMGLVLVGVGASGLYAAAGDPVLAALALTAALLHVLTHAAFKTLLFLAAGSVVHATGVRDLDALGGLRTVMPATTAAFGLGALAASALPPGPAFMSEWLLLQSLIHGAGTAPELDVVASIVLPLAVAAVALTAGLAVATFVKAFGVGFLARPRSDAAATARESSPSMLAGMGIAGAACTALALAPTVVIPGVAGVAAGVLDARPAVLGALTIELTGVEGAMSPLLLAAALAVAIATVVGALRLLTARRDAGGWKPVGPAGRVRTARPWDCGGGPMSARTEYTATSFAEPLQRVFDDVLDPVQDVDVTHHQESRYLVAAVAYRRSLPDRIETRLYAPVLSAAAAWGRAGRRLATGSVHRYLGYGFATLCALLLVLVVTR
ncbi:proton-conducting transporter membrane subunit [Pseudonocardia cypriaca]|uniref:Formate hydrogenlyase subunit 3/multisubunit Na+/H+ antiporter MnhD subunit n=1 Tax=Pseudonocardia cypriaca TaxID=882449 RepID=A0A543FSS3_9PSEU|nr:proton-conducting transporter membrane subunit [Pseudonocardia cypriaca]TQM36889.1 formate hydrogenlyase subunit 3/multisubunit Na+/H+ antiporter MnhD subunit [Pseudonocardia cypriaca]